MVHFTEPPPLKTDATKVKTMHYLLLTMEGRALYAKRTCTVEPVFEIIMEDNQIPSILTA